MISRASPGLVLALLAAACGGSSQTKADGGVDAGPTCETTADCESGQICAFASGKDGGRMSCTGCSTNGQCEPQQLCSSQNACVFRPGWGDQCALNADCSAGQLCDQGLCVSASAATLCERDNCATGERCNIANQVCEQDLGCTGNTDCLPSQACNLGTLTCVARCDPADAGAVCDPEQTCVADICVDCTASSGCGPGLTCDTASGTCTAPGLCYTDSSCAAGTVCDPATNTCVTTIVPCTSDDGCALDQVCDAVSGTCVSSTCEPDQFYPNQTQAEAAPVVAATTYTNLTLCGPTDADWYSLPLLSGDRLQVTIETDVTGSGYSFEAQFLDDAGDILATGQNLSLTGIAPTAGTYYLEMTDGDPSCVYAFSTIVSHGQTCPTDPLGDISTQATAAFIDGGVGPIYLCADQTDWFGLAAPQSGLNVTLGCDPTQGPLGLAVQLADGGLLAQSNDGTPLQTVTVPAGTPAPAYITVFGAGQTNAFTLSLTALSPDAGSGDAGLEADAGPDAGSDAGPDAGMDAGLDAGLDDGGGDGGPDAGGDGGNP